MKIYITGVILLFICISCSNSVTSPRDENQLLGSWSETYIKNYGFDIMVLEDSTVIKSDSIQTSIMTFTEDKFQLKILPPNHAVYLANNILYTDTLYTGSYYVSQDTLVFEVDSHDFIRKMHFNLENDSLYLANDISIYPGADFPIYEYSSFAWGDTFLKTSGTFGRVE